jgi:hypothetical protein
MAVPPMSNDRVPSELKQPVSTDPPRAVPIATGVPLAAAQLRRGCAIEELAFATTEERSRIYRSSSVKSARSRPSAPALAFATAASTSSPSALSAPASAR